MITRDDFEAFKSIVARIECPMCRTGQALNEQYEHPKGQPCYALDIWRMEYPENGDLHRVVQKSR